MLNLLLILLFTIIYSENKSVLAYVNKQLFVYKFRSPKLFMGATIPATSSVLKVGNIQKTLDLYSNIFGAKIMTEKSNSNVIVGFDDSIEHSIEFIEDNDFQLGDVILLPVYIFNHILQLYNDNI